MVRVGVTGHRMIQEVGQVTAGIDRAIREIETKFPDEVLVAVSSLAEGADRLVAARVLTSGGRLIVPLPLPPNEYCEDFPSQSSKQEFLELLERAHEVIDLPKVSGRTNAYRAAGRYVVDHCDALIAIWDGREARGPGGTSEVVAMARDRILPIAWIHVDALGSEPSAPVLLGKDEGGVSFENFDGRMERGGRW